jgi:DNA-binding CsgD family transcriptional regulator
MLGSIPARDPALQTLQRSQFPDAPPSGREVEVLKLIAVGLSNTEIAAALVVSAATVKTHVNHRFQNGRPRPRPGRPLRPPARTSLTDPSTSLDSQARTPPVR